MLILGQSSSCSLCLLLSVSLWTPVKGDVEVSCVFMESCILPCSFQGGPDSVLHWIQGTGKTVVHSYYSNQDQLGLQNLRFRGRTSVFKDQISRGNASLKLTGVEVQDQGRYKCFTSIISGNKESFINLKVDAPVRKVDAQQVENRITCSSEGIYPEPELTWSTSPPSTLTLLYKPTVQKTEQRLYNINSSLIVSDSVTDLVHSCNVSTHRNWRRATLFKITSINASDTETTIPCTSSNTPLTGLIWRFNHNQIILNQTRTNVPFTVSEEWRQQVKNVSESGSLTLRDLSSNQEGIYTCELSNEEETNITTTFLRIEKSQVNSNNAGDIIGGVVGAILVVVVVACLVFYCKKRKGQRRNRPKNDEPQQEAELKNLGDTNRTPSWNCENPANKSLLQEESSETERSRIK